jgi:hypothetical protein
MFILKGHFLVFLQVSYLSKISNTISWQVTENDYRRYLSEHLEVLFDCDVLVLSVDGQNLL